MGLEKINIYKKRLGITTEELSRLSGVPIGTLNKILNGTTKDPKLETLKALARVFKCTLDEFDDIDSITNIKEQSLLNHFNKLNSTGKDEAVKRVEELTHFNKYTDEEDYMMPVAAHNDHPLTDEELELMRQDLEDM